MTATLSYESVTWALLVVAILVFSLGGGFLIYRWVWVAFAGVAGVMAVFSAALFMGAVTLGFPPDECSQRCFDLSKASGPMFDVSLYVLPPLTGLLLVWALARWIVRGRRQGNWKPY